MLCRHVHTYTVPFRYGQQHFRRVFGSLHQASVNLQQTTYTYLLSSCNILQIHHRTVATAVGVHLTVRCLRHVILNINMLHFVNLLCSKCSRLSHCKTLSQLGRYCHIDVSALWYIRPFQNTTFDNIFFGSFFVWEWEWCCRTSQLPTIPSVPYLTATITL
jgi:hypothetical protein